MTPGTTQRYACVSCRQRKLRCDKQQPCANCVARAVECQEQSLPPTSRGVKRPLDVPDPAESTDILSRLERVEALVENAQKGPSASVGNELGMIRKDVLSQPSRGHGPLTRRGVQPNTSDGTGVHWVKISANDSFLRQALAHDLSISISPSKVAQHLDSHEIQLPPKQETLRLFAIYYDFVGSFQHIIYEPHARILVDDVYHQVAYTPDGTAPKGLALILSVVATSVILDPLNGSLDAALTVLRERLQLCGAYIRWCMDCLEQHRRRMSHSLESVQAIIVLQFLINHIETFSLRYRMLLTEGITVCHSLGFHLLDSTTTRGNSSQSDADPIVQEMKRRAWWYIAATDWTVCMAEGPFNAVYLVQPHLTTTNIPRHINDDDLADPNFTHQRPPSEPTTMSYVLQRLKVAEVARVISDTVPHDPAAATCETILSLDSRLESLIQNLPAFFRLEIASSPATRRVDREHPEVPMQRLLINLMVSLVRGRLHFPYLSGGGPAAADPALHAFSRRAGVRAARQVLAAHGDMIGSGVAHCADFFKVQGTVSHMFMGALVLATDLCCNYGPQKQGGGGGEQDGLTDDEERERERCSAELAAALGRLELVKRHSQIAAKFLESLTQLLVRYRVWAPGVSLEAGDGEGVVEGDEVEEEARVTSVDGFVDGGGGDGGELLDGQDFAGPSAFDELWDMFVEGPPAMDMFDLS